ncbi:MAG: hypothetical protein AB7G88_12930 [Thermomicrobiales bacterium]
MADAYLSEDFPLNLGGSGSSGGSAMDLLSDTLKLQLHTSTHTPSQGMGVRADLDNEVATGNGYTTGGATLSGKTYAVSSLVTTFDAADVSWTNLTKTHRYAWLYDDTPATPLDPLIGYVDSGGDQENTDTTLTYQWNAAGIFTFTVAGP